VTLRLDGKTALVTGASRGIGRAIAVRLASDGARVGVHYGTNAEAAKQAVADIEAAGGEAFSIHAELGADGDVDTLFAHLEDWLGGRPLDILVNNAGIGAFAPIDEITPAEFDRMFAVNVRAPFFITQRALSLLRDGGRVINVSSAAARIALPETAYAMTKGAIEVLGRNLAHTLGARGITVNTVAPGPIATDMMAFLDDAPDAEAGIVSLTALGRIGRPADVADAVSFLASDDARWVTGHVLDATGGLWLGPVMSA
jgi:3-oxoacyl-[acyl-carrier protein] reductase